jgi:hypothetical protein
LIESGEYDAEVRQPSLYFALLVIASAIAAGQQKAERDIVARLLPDGDPHRMVNPDPAEKGAAIKELRSAQKTATEERLAQVAFLLAAYGSDYEKNRDYLIEDLRGCTTPAIKSGCDGNIADYLIVLYERGHKDVLKPMMLVGKDSYSAAVAESLGSFLSNFLIDSPDAFFDTIRPFTPDAQKDLCGLAGTADGGGLSAEKLQRVRKTLNAKNDELSLTCLQAIEAANKRE